MRRPVWRQAQDGTLRCGERLCCPSPLEAIGVGAFIHGKGTFLVNTSESLPSNHTTAGDLLVAGLADTLVRCCRVPPDIGPAVNKSDCFRVAQQTHGTLLRTPLLELSNRKAFAAEENHGMTHERINLASAKALPVCPPLLEQQLRIVAKIDQLMALVDELEIQIAASRDMNCEAPLRSDGQTLL